MQFWINFNKNEVGEIMAILKEAAYWLKIIWCINTLACYWVRGIVGKLNLFNFTTTCVVVDLCNCLFHPTRCCDMMWVVLSSVGAAGKCGCHYWCNKSHFLVYMLGCCWFWLSLNINDESVVIRLCSQNIIFLIASANWSFLMSVKSLSQFHLPLLPVFATF